MPIFALGGLRQIAPRRRARGLPCQLNHVGRHDLLLLPRLAELPTQGPTDHQLGATFEFSVRGHEPIEDRLRDADVARARLGHDGGAGRRAQAAALRLKVLEQGHLPDDLERRDGRHWHPALDHAHLAGHRDVEVLEWLALHKDHTVLLRRQPLGPLEQLPRRPPADAERLEARTVQLLLERVGARHVLPVELPPEHVVRVDHNEQDVVEDWDQVVLYRRRQHLHPFYVDAGVDQVRDELECCRADGDQTVADPVADGIAKEQGYLREMVGKGCRRVERQLHRQRQPHKGAADDPFLHLRHVAVEPWGEELPAEVAPVDVVGEEA
mmetsp:Transcript_22119/g.71413  ORF Transcript_22119/g.71413 Transcript_22119/m.71413 type:complete len:325 (-) Transcript_22119:272-1246(-)